MHESAKRNALFGIWEQKPIQDEDHDSLNEIYSVPPYNKGRYQMAGASAMLVTHPDEARSTWFQD